MTEVCAGAKVRMRDVAAVMKLVEKRIAKSSKQPIDGVWLSLAVAETLILTQKRNWDYNEPVAEAIAGVRLSAQAFAEALYVDAFGKDELIKGN